MSIRGGLDRIAGRVVQGWVVTEDEAAVVSLLANGVQVGEAVAKEPAVEVGARAFSIALDRRFSREGDVRFEAQISGQTFAMLQASYGAGLSDLFAGHIEEVTEGAIRGWAINLGPVETPVTVNVFLGSLWLGAAVTDRMRGDIRRRFGLQTPAGFAFPIPSPFRGSEPRVFRLFYANTAIEMEGSPLVVPEARTGPSADALAALMA